MYQPHDHQNSNISLSFFFLYRINQIQNIITIIEISEKNKIDLKKKSSRAYVPKFVVSIYSSIYTV